jgi:hypothetical protein
MAKKLLLELFAFMSLPEFCEGSGMRGRKLLVYNIYRYLFLQMKKKLVVGQVSVDLPGMNGQSEHIGLQVRNTGETLHDVGPHDLSED